METSDKELLEAASSLTAPSQPATPYTATSNPYQAHYYQTSPSDMPQDMSLNSLNQYNYSTSSSERMSSSIEEGYRWTNAPVHFSPS